MFKGVMLLSSDQNQRYNCSQSQQTPVTYAGLRVKLSGNHNHLLQGKPRAYNTETKHTLFRWKTSKQVAEVQNEKRKRSGQPDPDLGLSKHGLYVPTSTVY